MKQEPEEIRGIKSYTHNTLLKLKTQIVQKFLKPQFKACSIMLGDLMECFENFVTEIINSLGNEYTKLSKKMTTIDSALLVMKGQNNYLKSELESAKSVILQKQLKIQALESTNATLSENVLLLQTVVSIHNSSEVGEFQDSLQNIDIADLEEYNSNQSSEQSEVQQVYQQDENA